MCSPSNSYLRLTKTDNSHCFLSEGGLVQNELLFFFSNIKFILKRSNLPCRIYVKIMRSKALRGSQKSWAWWQMSVITFLGDSCQTWLLTSSRPV